jgi:hypothetical protein
MTVQTIEPNTRIANFPYFTGYQYTSDEHGGGLFARLPEGGPFRVRGLFAIGQGPH